MYDVLIQGFPGRTSRGFLGWSTISLLDTSSGPVLFDTGAAGDRPGLMQALAERGLAPADIRTIVLSHLHFDHVGNVECFPNAVLVLHQTELSYYYDRRAGDPALPLFLIEGMLARCKLQLIHGELELFPGIQLIRTPGHTAGHISLALDIAGETHVLCQDAIKNRAEATSGEATGAHDAGAARASIARILAMADFVVPGHDAALRIGQGTVTPSGNPRAAISSTLDGRVMELEA